MRTNLRRTLDDERGIALALTMFALVLIGALVGGAIFIARLERRMGSNSLFASQAFQAAEAGLASTFANWNPTNNQLANNTTMSLGATTVTTGVRYTPSITRLSSSLFLVRSVGERTVGSSTLSRRESAVVARLVSPQMNIKGAITVQGTLTLGGSANISGVDDQPGGWGASCPPTGPTIAGIASNSSTVNTNGSNCSGLGCVTGSPKLLTDTTINANTFTQFGPLNFNDLAAQAKWTVSGTLTGLQPSVSGGQCNYGDQYNWGEPVLPSTKSACFNYFPIIYAPGDLRISGGRGQGFLLVGGDLELSGGVDFYGLAIVLGNIRSTGTGGHIYGAAMAQNADLNPTTITGNSVVQYSSCAVLRARINSATAKPLTQRPWTMVYE